MGVSTAPGGGHHDLIQALLGLSRKARSSNDTAELNFLLVNATHQLLRYRQAFLWVDGKKPVAASGVIEPEPNSPMMRWLATLYEEQLQEMASGVIEVESFAPSTQESWQEFLPAFAVWFSGSGNKPMGLLLARDVAWQDAEVGLLNEWWQIWLHAHQALEMRLAKSSEPLFKNVLKKINNPQLPWYRRTIFRALAVVLVVMLLPVKMTVIAPGQIVPSDPVWVTSPIDGVISEFYVDPGQRVEADDPLFRFDDEMLLSQLKAAEHSYNTARARYEQVTQQALGDERYMERLAELMGKVEQSRVELAYLDSQSTRSLVTADKSGVVLFEHPSEWIGKPVSPGEQVMKIIDPDKKEIEAWLAIEDAIPITDGASVKLHVNSAPFSPVKATVSFVAYDASERPNGSYAYRLRASLDNPTSHRVGLKGTVRVSGDWTTLIYWLLRRPIGSLRAMVGF